MGKTTLYHPVSLHVIRGAAEYCGFKFGRIKQIRALPDIQFARYIAEIVSWPDGWEKQPLSVMQKKLQNCFMDDILVQWLRTLRAGKIVCDIAVQVSGEVESK